MTEKFFWRRKALDKMTRKEWESLCDGCAKCCLEKLEADDNGEITFTEVACRMLDLESCRCREYARRLSFVSDCVSLRPGGVTRLKWIPSTCAYKMLAEGKDLPEWHPLVSGDPESVHRAGMSVRGRAVPGALAGDLEDHAVTWPEQEKA